MRPPAAQAMRVVINYVETVCERILDPTQHPRGWLAAGPWINDAVEYGAHLGAQCPLHTAGGSRNN